MYLRFARRRKDGKEHRYWSIVESRRCAGGRVVQRPVLYLGEINDGQREAWCRQIETFDEANGRHRQLALFPAERTVPDYAKGFGVQVRLDAMELHRPRQWGACWLACHLYGQLQLDRFFAPLLPNSREGTNWQHILQTLVCYRLIDPGSEWRLHRQWFEQSAMADLLGEDYALVAKNALYRCLDKLLPHKAALFSHLRARWQDLFAAKFDVLLYDLTSTYFESPPPDDETDKRRHGYSRYKRSDCVQVVIALIVTPEGFPLGYEVLPGNTSDKTTFARHAAKDRRAVWQGQPRLGDGPRHSDRGGAGRDARGRSAGFLSGRHSQGAAVQAGETPRHAALAGGARGRRREVLTAGSGTLRAGAKPCAHQQGTRHAQAQTQMAMGAAQGDRRHGPRSRGTAHEARRRARQGTGGLAPRGCRGGARGRCLQLHARSRQAAPGAAARRPLSAAHQSHRQGPGRAVAVLHPARRDRGRLQDHEGRSAPAPDPPPARAPHRGAHLRGVPGLLPARHAACTAQAAGAWPHAESCARQVRSDPNARRAFPDHRRPHLDPQPLHRNHRRPETSGPPTQTRSSATEAATYHRARKDPSPPSQRRVVETFAMPALILLIFFAQLGKLG